MNKVRRFLWTNLGITLNRQTLFVSGAVLITCIAVVLFALAPAGSLLRFVLILIALPGIAALLGSIYRPLWWGVSNKKARAKLEVEVSLKQWKAHAEENKTGETR